MFAMAAYMNPPMEKRKISTEGSEEVYEYFLDGKLTNSMKKKIASLFEVALQKGHDSLILSSIGCGAYANPTFHIATLFKEMLNCETYRNRFKLVLFSIIEDKNAANNIKNTYQSSSNEKVQGKSNLSIFSKVFHGKEDAYITIDTHLENEK